MLTGDDLPERLPEVGVEDGVDDRVEGRVDVPQPRDEADELKKYVMTWMLDNLGPILQFYKSDWAETWQVCYPHRDMAIDIVCTPEPNPRGTRVSNSASKFHS